MEASDHRRGTDPVPMPAGRARPLGVERVPRIGIAVTTSVSLEAIEQLAKEVVPLV